MSDIAYANALKRQEELRKELADVERFLALYRQFSGTPPEQIESPRVGGGRNTPVSQLSLYAPKVGPAEYAEMAERLIRDARRPLTRSELVEGLQRKGISFPTEDAPRYLGTILWRNRDRFRNVPGLGYTLPDLLTPDHQRRIYEANARSADISDDVKRSLSQVARRLIREKNIEPLAPDAAIPTATDRILLTAAGEELGRTLYEPERLALREAAILESMLL